MYKRITVVVVDEHALSREGILSVLSMAEDLQVVGSGANKFEAMVLNETKRPQVLLLDVESLKPHAIEATTELLRDNPHLRIIMMANHADEDHAIAALKCGAAGYLLKDMKGEDLINAIRLVVSGYIPLAAAVGAKLVKRLQSKFGPAPTAIINRLSESETRVLELLGAGLTNQQIAGYLSLSEGTVKNYVSKILMTLEVKDRTQAALWAYEHLMEAPPTMH